MAEVSSYTPPAALEMLLGILHSHLLILRQKGRAATTVLMHEQEAARWRAQDATAVFGIPIEHAAALNLGYCALQLDDGTQYAIALPAWFTED